MVILLSEKRCKCGEKISGRKIDIKSFKQDMFTITEQILKIWSGSPKKCWRCKKTPQIGEVWGMSINYKEKNRLFCPKCSVYIADNLLNETT